MHVCVLSRFSCVQLLKTLWTVAHQALLSVGILQARILEWVAIAFSDLDSVLKSRDITLPTKVHLVNAMVFPVVMYGVKVGL